MKEIKDRAWVEAIRKRPGMYIGHTSSLGFYEIIKGLVALTVQVDQGEFSLEITGALNGNITLGVKNQITINWSDKYINFNTEGLAELAIIIALSRNCKLLYRSTNNEEVCQEFVQGYQRIGPEAFTMECSELIINFDLDDKLWHNDFILNGLYLSDKMRILAYLLQNTSINIKYKSEDLINSHGFKFKNGINDLIGLKALECYQKPALKNCVEYKLKNYTFKWAYCFLGTSVDQPYLQSFACNRITYDGGEHLNGFVDGLVAGAVMFNKKLGNHTSKKINKYHITNLLIGAIHILTDRPEYGGATRNRLVNVEIYLPLKAKVQSSFYHQLMSSQEEGINLLSRIIL